MRLAEVYLNYAEAVVENGSGFGDKELAENYLNALRRRAGHTDRISLTLESVLKERRVEMAFEGKRFWDMSCVSETAYTALGSMPYGSISCETPRR